MISSLCRVSFCRSPRENTFTLGKIFWQALLRGGYQGAVYCLDTLQNGCGNGKAREEKLAEWIELMAQR